LTASPDGRELLKGTQVAAQLRRLVGDLSVISSSAIKAMINLSADAAMLEQLLKQGMVSALMESLRDDSCGHRRLIVMLLNNLSQTGEGCSQILQRSEAGGSLMGLHFRRLIQWFVAPVKGPVLRGDPELGNEADTFEHVAGILSNVTQESEARLIILEPERGILPALLPQLRSPSTLRRRGVAGTLRNCCFEEDERLVRYMLSPGVDVATAALLPLAGPAEYKPEETVGMADALAHAGFGKQREADAQTRRALVEALLLLCLTRAGRDHLRSVRAYAVIRAFHRWLESEERLASLGIRSTHGGAGAGAGSERASSADNGGVLVTTRGGGAEEAEEELLPPEDLATVSAINRLVQQLFREDEVSHTSQVTGVSGSPRPEGAAGAKPAASGSASGAAGARLRPGVTIVPEAEAKAKAAAVSRGAEVDDGELDALVTPAPDWTEDDPELPPAFQAAYEAGKAHSAAESKAYQAEAAAAAAAAPTAPAEAAAEGGDAAAATRAPASAVDGATAGSAAGSGGPQDASVAAALPSASVSSAPHVDLKALHAVEAAGLGDID
jgi:hypothetical protein